ncbi:MAG: MBL fold metallo-hydrolase [Candidatus Nezhaarchaeales archaeon]
MTILVILGSGASEGIPALNCRCESCQEAKRMPIAKRMPTSILVLSKANFLVDVGFDVMNKIGDLDLEFILLTHWHPDHYSGLFRLRWSSRPISLYAPKDGLIDEFKREPKNLVLKFVQPYETFVYEGIKITPIPLIHKIETLGYLIDDGNARIAILFDGRGPSNRDVELIRGFETNLALIDATNRPNFYDPNHNNIDEAIEIGRRVKANLTVLTHIAHHNMPFTELTSYVRKFEGIVLGYDDMVLHL